MLDVANTVVVLPATQSLFILRCGIPQAAQDLQAARTEHIALRTQLSTLRKQAQQAEAAAQQAHKELHMRQAQQERQHKRHAEIYARLQQVMVRHRGKPPAGAVAAAARELRPLELVAVFDRQQQALEVRKDGKLCLSLQRMVGL